MKNRGPYRKSESKLITLYIPVFMLPAIDEAVRKLDLDKSKFIRQAVREKLARAGIKVEAA